MENEYSVTFTWTDEEFLALSKFCLFQRSKKRKWSIAIIGLCAIFLTVIQIYQYITIGEIENYTNLFLIIFGFFLEYNLLFGWKRQALKYFHSNKLICGVEETVTFTDTALKAIMPTGESHLEYSQLDSIAETPTHIFVFETKLSGISIPKANCSPEFIAKVQSVMEAYPMLRK